MCKSTIKKLIYLLIRVTPKFDYCYVKALPSFEDSAVAVYEKLSPTKFRKVIWSVYHKEDQPPFKIREGTGFVVKGSIRDFFYGIFSKYVFTTHGHFIPKIPPNQICVNLWHGMPYKAIGLLNDQPGRQDTCVCSTSSLYQKLLSRAFGISQNRVLITGLPRNDLLHSDNPYSVWEKTGIDRSRYDKVFFWLPTFRKSIVGYLCEDGVECDNVFNMVDFPVERFNRFLKEGNCLCIIKPHPMAPVKNMVSTDHLLLIDENWLWQRQLTLYPLVGETDFLVSDVSSIMIDYMLLDKPMVVCFGDFSEYKESRNLLFDPIEDWLPGEMVMTYEALEMALRRCIDGEDFVRTKRQQLRDKCHAHLDFDSTKRLLEHVF